MTTDRLDIHQIVHQAAEFNEELAARKAQIDPAMAWYPYDSLGVLYEMDKLLTEEWAYPLDLAGNDPVLDLCCADGDLSFFLESLGCRVTAVDLPHTNCNRMAGVRAVKAALNSPLEIREMDLDGPFQIEGQYGLVFFLGALYHLKNPFYVLETLAQHARYAVITTRVARFTPEARLPIRDAPVAYLVGESETNRDSTNYWIFSETGLRRLLDRTNWIVCRFLTLGNTESSDPASGEGDERAYCLLRSRRLRQQPHLLEGWHMAEPHGWRWTARRFSVAFHDVPKQGRAHLRLNFAMPEVVLDRVGPVTLSAKAGGTALASVSYSTPGEHIYQASLPSPQAPLTIEFELDKAIPPGDVDKRELGLIVTSLELD